MRLGLGTTAIALAISTFAAFAAGGCTSVGVGVGGPGVGVGVEVAAQPNSSAEVQALVDRINRHRTAIGCGTLAWDARLATVARKHSEDMSRRHFFSHTNPDGKDPFDRLRAAGIHYHAAGENIGKGQTRGHDMYDDWIESSGHRHNLGNCEYTHVGVGYYDRHWTLVLARFGE